jgi:hypothetical protein
MADTLPTQDIGGPPTGAPLVYRPISGVALVGFVLSCLFGALVLITTLFALAQGSPIFLPGWAIALAAAGAVVSLIAQVHIRRSEGILAGNTLAAWGLWLSVVVGATYFVYTWVTGLALAKQATDFLMIKSDEDSGFFPRVQNAAKNRTDLYQAFLLSLPATSRGGSMAANEQAMLAQYDQPGRDGEPGSISLFSKRPLMQALMKNPENLQIEPLGVAEWTFENNAYRVVRNFRFTTREWVIETIIPVQSSEGTQEGEQRKWWVNIARMPRLNSVAFTTLGQNLSNLRNDSRNYLEKWRAHLTEGTPVPEYNPADTDWEKILPKKPLQQQHVRKMLKEVLNVERRAPLQMTVLTDDLFADYRQVSGRIEVLHPLKMILPAADSFPNFNIELEIDVATKNPIDLTRQLGPTFQWDIKALRVVRAVPAPRVKGPV